MTMGEVTKVASGVVDGMKSQPLALALVVVNVLFLIAGGLFVYYIGGAIRAERNAATALLQQVMDHCGKPQS